MENTSVLSNRLLPIQDIAKKLALLPEEFQTIGPYGAKLSLDLLDNPAFPVRGKLILVTATTPTTSGEGKTVVSIGLAQGLEHIGQKSILTSREPSLGPSPQPCADHRGHARAGAYGPVREHCPRNQQHHFAKNGR